jgi:hypothetical protein
VTEGGAGPVAAHTMPRGQGSLRHKPRRRCANRVPRPRRLRRERQPRLGGDAVTEGGAGPVETQNQAERARQRGHIP